MGNGEEGLIWRLLRSLFSGSGAADRSWEKQSSGTRFSKTIVYKKSVLKIVKNGKEQTIQSTDAEMPELAQQLGMSTEDLMNLADPQKDLGTSEVAKIENSFRNDSTQEAITCVKCQGKTRGRATCQWCGAELVRQSEHETVDDKFLKHDVQPEGVKDTQDEKLRNTLKAAFEESNPEIADRHPIGLRRRKKHQEKVSRSTKPRNHPHAPLIHHGKRSGPNSFRTFAASCPGNKLPKEAR